MSLIEPTKLELEWQATSAKYNEALKTSGVCMLVGFGVGITFTFIVPLLGLGITLATAVVSSLITRKPKKAFYAAHEARMAELTEEGLLLDRQLARFSNRAKL